MNRLFNVHVHNTLITLTAILLGISFNAIWKPLLIYFYLVFLKEIYMYIGILRYKSQRVVNIGVIIQRLLYTFLGSAISYRIGGGGRIGAFLAAIFIAFIAYEIYNLLFNKDITAFANRYSKGVIDRKLQILFLLILIVAPILNFDDIRSPFWFATLLIVLLNTSLTLATDGRLSLAPSLSPMENRSFFIFLYDIAWVGLGIYTILI